MYSARKRRKPAQKGVKPAPADSTKSNPSKRHRDRLNSELDRLARMLPFPQDVVSSLDKLSILRLSVSFLRTKSFFSVTLRNQLPGGDHGVPEGELLLQALNGFVLVVTAGGTVFFCSHTVQDYLGFHQTDVMHHSVLELIHTEDQQEFRSNLHWALNPPTEPSTGDGESSCLRSHNPDQLPLENSSFLERGFVCRFRCLLDNSSGFLALNVQGRLKPLHGQSCQRSAPPQLALFAIATPLQCPAILEIRTRNMIFRTKHKLDFTPMSCDAKGKLVLGYTEAELRVRGSGYQFIHAADMLYCAENHVRMMKTGESGLTVFRLLTKDNRWTWVQANARLVYKNSKPDYIIATQRPLADEEGGEHLRKRSMHLPFTFATGEATLYQTAYPLHGFPDSFQGKAKGSKSKKGNVDKTCSDDLDPKSLLGALMSQDGSVYVCQPDPEPQLSYHGGLFSEPQAGGTLGGASWHMASSGETGSCTSKAPSADPLLATLDSLSLGGEEPCSNSELFSALENLGLDAEDLELLLLDQRMIQVELDHVPTLGDLLTNNEILSYIQDSLERGAEGAGQVGGPSAQSASRQPPAGLVPEDPPIMQLSQQMLQHMNADPGPTQSSSQPGPVDPTARWLETNNHSHAGLGASQLSGDHEHLLQEASPPWLQQDRHPVHLQSHQQPGSQGFAWLPGLQNQLSTNGSYVPNGRVQVGLAGYTPAPGACHYQSSYQLQGGHKPPQSSALGLEQLLGQPQHSLLSSEAYAMLDSPHGKLECHPRLPDAHRSRDLPDGPAALQDPHKSGFLL